MKILELTAFSAGACGVWQRVKQESLLLSKEHQVMIFSSNAVKDSGGRTIDGEEMNGIKIKRFPFVKLGGESFFIWDFEKEALDFNPDLIIAHVYRHPHTTKALKIAKKSNAKCFLVTHAPFVEKKTTRSFVQDTIVSLYDKTIGSLTINKFDKVISITKWEEPHLFNLGLKQDNLQYIPNGIPEAFFKQKKSKPTNKILFLGRIAPIKNLEVLISSITLLNNKETLLEIVGPADKRYLAHLKALVKEKGIEKRVIFTAPIYDLRKKIMKIDTAEIFVLPSKREAMPQALIEAMARGKIVISSKTIGGMEIISDKQNGFLFDIGDKEQLAKIINIVHNLTKKEKDKIIKNARATVSKFKWKNLIKNLL